MDLEFVVIGCGNVGSNAIALLSERGVKSAAVADTTGIYEVQNLEHLVKLKRHSIGLGRKMRLLEIVGIPGSKMKRIGDLNSEILQDVCDGKVVISALPTSPEFEPGAASYLNYHAVQKGKLCIAVDKSHVYPNAYDKLKEYITNGRFVPIGSILAPCQVWDLIRQASVEGGEGVVNGTTNYMVNRMGEGLGFESALQEAKSKGYADPHKAGLGFGDLVGLDASVKMMVLARMMKPENAGVIPVVLELDGNRYRIDGGTEFVDDTSGEAVPGEKVYLEVRKELEKIHKLKREGKTIRQIATIDGKIKVSFEKEDCKDFEDLTGTLNRLKIYCKGWAIDEKRLLEIYDEVHVDGKMATCSIKRLGTRWSVHIEENEDSLVVQGPGAGALETATSLVDACLRRI